MQIGADGHLWIGGCDAVWLAEQFGTPLFVYDEQLLRERIRAFHAAFRAAGVERYQVAYASKAFCTVAMCQLVTEEGCTLDVVSGGELYTALSAGVHPSRIHMHGNNKSREELEYAIDARIGTIVADNFYELELLEEIAGRRDLTVEILLRIAPGVAAHTHEYISTGQQDSKFGFDLESGQARAALEAVQRLPHVRLVGLHAHIGSQIFDSGGFVLAVERLAGLYEQGMALGLPLRVLNAGGGFGIRYTAEDDAAPITSHIRAITDAVRRSFAARSLELPEIWVEPGRSIAGPAGVTLYTVGSQKEIPGVRRYVAVDGGMTDNPRLALYGARYEAVLANRVGERADTVCSVAGKCCETGDMVIWDAPLPEPRPGDILAVFATGAYNYSMASHYNRIPHPAVVFVRDGRATLVVERETWADVARFDRPLSYKAAYACPQGRYPSPSPGSPPEGDAGAWTPASSAVSGPSAPARR
ncbi:MAG: diaminopimelate decarboxylase [Alicyclobacillaceae bacterium]|nr:diaminopimelate decarboxylase [Alicyclobacillaceae bacterium]